MGKNSTLESDKMSGTILTFRLPHLMFNSILPNCLLTFCISFETTMNKQFGKKNVICSNQIFFQTFEATRKVMNAACKAQPVVIVVPRSPSSHFFLYDIYHWCIFFLSDNGKEYFLSSYILLCHTFLSYPSWISSSFISAIPVFV